MPLNELEKILAPARAAGIGLHLDGARLPLYFPYFGIDPADVAALFDTVYVSLYKCFSAPSGAVLAGPASLINDLYHTRRMFGGGLNEAWPMAAVALHHLDDYAALAQQVVAMAEDLFSRLREDGRVEVERIPNGTNVFRLKRKNGDGEQWRLRLLEQGVEMPAPQGDSGVFVCKMNLTWIRSSVEELGQKLLDCC